MTGQTDAPPQLSKTDATLLDHLRDGRSTPSILSDEDDVSSSRSYVSKRLSKMRDQGLVELVDDRHISLYQITPKGDRALDAWRELRTALAES
ncbi:hypothetical protein AMS69_17855 [Haloarcula rubripromontorii]|uniref:Transcriptional regulator n=1 Tax=Haloarcula rubripromontorii TaxID=1705562 RepID=A0A0M9AGI1_9EURY|nr:winged helix-turn-helix domain-containing protein [Haloarcula rubripromontorii]KOX91587.1 hypothetical protein AMS69_17855 [Haloarcula rubripromontorii]